MIERFALFVGMLVAFTLLSSTPTATPRFHVAWAAAATTTTTQPTAPAAQPAAVLTGDARAQWAADLADRLGNDHPSPEIIAFIVAWTKAEDACMSGCGYSSAWERHNPLNTTQTGYGETATINGDGVKGYPDYEHGMQATVQTLSYGYYTEIVAGIRANDPERALKGLYASPWGTDARDVESIYRGGS
jgi:hypothetical protein